MAQAHMHQTGGEQTIGMEAAVHLIAMAAKALLILGGAILIGEVVVTSERRLHGQQKGSKQMVAEDATPVAKRGLKAATPPWPQAST